MHALKCCLVRESMVGHMVTFWWNSVAQATAASLLGVVVLPWVIGVDYWTGKSDKAMVG